MLHFSGNTALSSATCPSCFWRKLKAASLGYPHWKGQNLSYSGFFFCMYIFWHKNKIDKNTSCLYHTFLLQFLCTQHPPNFVMSLEYCWWSHGLFACHTCDVTGKQVMRPSASVFMGQGLNFKGLLWVPFRAVYTNHWQPSFEIQALPLNIHATVNEYSCEPMERLSDLYLMWPHWIFTWPSHL